MRGILYAALEIVMLLLIASAIGFALGWYVVSRLRRSRADHAVAALETERDGLKIELDRAWARVDEAKQRLEVAYEKLDQLTEPAATLAPVPAAAEPVRVIERAESTEPVGALDFAPSPAAPSLVDVLPAAAPAPANGDTPAVGESEAERIARLEARLAEQAAIMERLADRMSELQD